MFLNLLRKFHFKGKNRLLKILPFKKNIKVVPYLFNSLIEINTNELIGHEIFWNNGYEKM